MRKFWPVIILLLFFVVGGTVALFHHPPKKPAVPSPASQATASQTAKPKLLDHIFVILEENKPYTDVIGSSNAPYINSLVKQYASASDYNGVTHPSLPNYLALTSGSNDGITNDCSPPGTGCQADVKNIADELEHANLTWKEYAESMPSNCYAQDSGTYAVRHDPFVYYPDIRNDANRCQTHVVPYTQLATDLNGASTTPDFAFITPNLCSDMHDCPVMTGDTWLSTEVPKILNSQAFTTQKSLLIIVWDEGDSGSNHIPALFVGPDVKTGYTAAGHYDHYSLLRAIENNWNLPTMTANDKAATPITGILK